MFAKLKRNIELKWLKLSGVHKKFYPEYFADGFGTRHKNTGFLDDPAFDKAWREICAVNAQYWGGTVPDVRWRMHVCLWAARNGMHLEGDFVECGVNTGLFSAMICKLLPIGTATDRRFWLFDTYSGIPEESLPEAERAQARIRNQQLYGYDAYQVASKVFAEYPSARLVKGILPGSLAEADISRIAYLSVDLNVMAAEIASGEALWDKLSPGAMIVLDDYAFRGHEDQYNAWNAFTAKRGISVLTLPTGQGLIQKPA